MRCVVGLGCSEFACSALQLRRPATVYAREPRFCTAWIGIQHRRITVVRGRTVISTGTRLSHTHLFVTHTICWVLGMNLIPKTCIKHSGYTLERGLEPGQRGPRNLELLPVTAHPHTPHFQIHSEKMIQFVFDMSQNLCE